MLNSRTTQLNRKKDERLKVPPTFPTTLFNGPETFPYQILSQSDSSHGQSLALTGNIPAWTIHRRKLPYNWHLPTEIFPTGLSPTFESCNDLKYVVSIKTAIKF